MMDYDKLIERLNAKLQSYAAYTDSEFAHVMEDAIAAIEALRADLEQERAHRIHAEQHADAFLRDCERLNAELERVKAERDGAEKEITRLKAIMREKGIFTIPAKYPWEKPEWNL